ncbi:hypothetical protein PFISCL1PPCAC_1968, partial [Pristionchus fissidentatus]
EEEEEEEEEKEKEREYLHSTSTSTSTPIPAEEQEEEEDEEEKRKTEEAYLSIKNSGSCSGILDSRLEDDCDNGNWKMRYFFSSEKGKCRAFWYGGCKVDVHNFYPTEEACKLSCGNHYPVEEGHFQQAVQHYEKKEKKEEERTTTTAKSVTSTTPKVVSWTTKLAPMDVEISGEESTTTTQAPPTSQQPAAAAYTVYPIEHSIKNRGSISYSTTEMPHPAEEDYDEKELPPSIPAGAASDPCDDPIDTRLEEECSTTWEYRAYFDASAKKCIKFWFGGCEIKSRNLFLDSEACRAVCHHKLPSSSPLIISTLPPPTTTSIPSTTSIIPTTSPLRECLAEHNRDAPARECGKEGRNWTQRYFFDHATRSCRMYWGCEGSSSPNNFPDLLTCQWKCEPQRAWPKSVKSCLDPLDSSLEDDCNGGNFMTKFHFDFQSKKCVAFHYGGCRSPSHNIFEGVEECKTTCERPDHTVSQSCLEAFDRGFLNTCNVNSRFEPKYYYDSSTGSCSMFWWGGCRRGAANFFTSLDTCKWSCERPKRSEGPKQCADKFDEKLTEACQDGQWRERFYFDHEKASCVPFWWDGCFSESANFFRDIHSCQSLCEKTESEIGSVSSTLKEEFRCLEEKKVGDCRETYPAYYYDRVHRECRPFSYSGCGGNGNRFLTLGQCEGLCRPFTLLSEVESSCYLPLDTGHSEGECGKAATVSFHFDRSSGSCAQFWFRGCGGNGNRFDSLATCNRICTTHRRPGPIRKTRSTHACFESSADRGVCAGGNSSALQKYTYQGGKCVLFSWSGCGGSANRFNSQRECEQLCNGLKPSNTPAVCSFDADWGPCNQLSHKWFFNQTTGFCAQFLYGGCGGNTNRFDQFDTCQKTCEVTGIDVCMETIDRGDWCEPMSNR